MIIEIFDNTLPELDPYYRLTDNQLRNRLEPRNALCIAESTKVIRTALQNGYTPVSFLMEKKHIEGQAKDILDLYPNVPVYTGERELLASLTGYTLTRGILCALKRPFPPLPETICKDARRIAVLSGIVDATNIGAIFRSAAALGMDAILLTGTCCDPLIRRAIRVSMGTVFQIPWGYLDMNNDAETPNMLKRMGFKTVAMALTPESVALDDPKLKAEQKLAVILGAEGDGLSHAVIEGCDYSVRIPMYHDVDSLNVAAASAVAFWELCKQSV